LNLTGFRKALKKFEKVTKIPVQTAYMEEKVCLADQLVKLLLTHEQVQPSAFAADQSLKEMIRETEELFAARFCKPKAYLLS
jgi:hypothetical protein